MFTRCLGYRSGVIAYSLSSLQEDWFITVAVIVLNGGMDMRISGSSPWAGEVVYICNPCAGEQAGVGGCSGLTGQPIEMK